MAESREPAFVALFERFTPLTEIFRTIGRRHPQEPPPALKQPALFLGGGHRRVKQEKGKPPKWNIGAFVAIYFRPSADLAIPPMEQANDLIAIVETALERKPDEQGPLGSSRTQTTLGGLCEVCWIAEQPEEVVILEGIQDGQGFILIPIEMVNVG